MDKTKGREGEGGGREETGEEMEEQDTKYLITHTRSYLLPSPPPFTSIHYMTEKKKFNNKKLSVYMD